jgi:hypothetical protein
MTASTTGVEAAKRTLLSSGKQIDAISVLYDVIIVTKRNSPD